MLNMLNTKQAIAKRISFVYILISNLYADKFNTYLQFSENFIV